MGFTGPNLVLYEQIKLKLVLYIKGLILDFTWILYRLSSYVPSASLLFTYKFNALKNKIHIQNILINYIFNLRRSCIFFFFLDNQLEGKWLKTYELQGGKWRQASPGSPQISSHCCNLCLWMNRKYCASTTQAPCSTSIPDPSDPWIVFLQRIIFSKNYTKALFNLQLFRDASWTEWTFDELECPPFW